MPEPAHPSSFPWCLQASTGALQLGEREKKLLALIQKQDRLLYICFYLLLNLAEDINVERKMKKKVRGGGTDTWAGCGHTRCGHHGRTGRVWAYEAWTHGQQT